jgi:outer membrane receptor protein involved in Fe transport
MCLFIKGNIMKFSNMFLAGSCTLAILAGTSSAAFAQNAEDEIIVTGSRIAKTTNANSPQPLVTFDESEFSETGALTISEALNELPQLGDSLEGGSSINSLNAGFGVGTQTVNLRNLGANRTLVLVNGRRHVGGDIGTSAVDLATIPSYMVDRIDVVTGASSAVYGADAVTGVVNVILKENFEGTEIGLRGGVTSEGDGEEFALNAVHGGEFDGGEYVLAAEYSTQGDIIGADRSFAQFDGSAATGTSEAGFGSGVNGGGLFVTPNGVGGFDASGNFASPFAERFQRVPFRSLQNETDRFVLSGRGSVDVSDNVTAFAEASYASTDVTVQFEPQLAVFRGFAGAGTAGFRFPNLPDPNGTIPFDPITRRFTEFGPRSSEINRDLFRFTVGADGDWGGGTWHASYQFGQVDATQTDFETVDKGRLLTAIDPTACANTTGCQFVDIFGRGTIDPASEAFVSEDLESDSEATQHVISAYVTGDAFELGAGNISYVLGAEYRDESATIRPNDNLIAVIDPFTGSGNLVGTQGTRTFFGDTDGGYDVLEGFAEVSIPVTTGFNVNLSGRVSDYSTVGTEYTYGLNADWAISDAVSARASFGRATRAPNVNELFAPERVSTTAISDPCDTQDDAGGALTPAAGCAAFGAGFNPTDLDQQISGVSGGNSGLGSETANSLTLGAVFSPSSSTVFSIDYFSIDLDDVLAPAFGAQATLDRCISSMEAVFCDNITRAAGTNFVTSIRSEQVNLAEESVDGLEFAVRQSFDVGEAELRFDGTFTHLLSHDRRVNDETDVEDLAGRVDNIENKARGSLRYIQDNWSLGSTVRYLDSAVQSIDADPAVAVGNDIGSVFYVDLFGNFDISEKLSFSAGVENLFNEKAPIVTQLFENNGSADTVASGIYDIRGTFGYAGVKYKF